MYRCAYTLHRYLYQSIFIPVITRNQKYRHVKDVSFFLFLHFFLAHRFQSTRRRTQRLKKRMRNSLRRARSRRCSTQNRQYNGIQNNKKKKIYICTHKYNLRESHMGSDLSVSLGQTRFLSQTSLPRAPRQKYITARSAFR